MKMTKNGLNILNPYAITIEMYDENGKLYKVPLEDVSEINTNNVYAGETLYTFLYILHKKAFIFAICAMVN